MTHPNSIDLEAFACGDEVRSVAEHVDGCADCSAFIERARAQITLGRPTPSEAKQKLEALAARDVPHLADRASEPAATPAPRTRWRPWSSGGVVVTSLAAAAALVLLLQGRSTRDVLLPPPTPTTSAPTTPASPPTVPDPGTTFKGGVQLAVVRERDGEQVRSTGTVRVRPGDRLRVELGLDREQPVVGAVLADDASWFELMPEGLRGPGVHLSEHSVRIDSTPMNGTLVVGPPDAVAQARKTKLWDNVVTLRIEWESPP
jgi:hypothetical protein